MGDRTPGIGEIWRDVDPRKERRVLVYNVGTHQVAIRTAHKVNGEWQAVRGSRVSLAAKERFDGKRGGYSFVE